MNRQQIRDALGQIAREAFASKEHAAESKQSAQRAYDMARRLERSLALLVDEQLPEPEPVEPPVVEPEADIVVTTHGSWMFIELPLIARQSLAGQWDVSGRARTTPLPFIEHFRTEAGGVTETICVLHNGNPEGRGAIIIPRLEVKTHDGRTIFDGKDVVVPPGGMYPIYDCPDRDNEAGWRFWNHYADKSIPQDDNWQERQLRPWLSKLDALYPKVNGARMAWDPEGARGGGQGIEPYRFEWRKCPAGFALAMQELIGVANRTTRCMTDANGKFTWDPSQPYTDVQEPTVNHWMPPAFKWTPKTDAEKRRAEWKNIDGQHAIRAWSAAMFLARETKHPFALWFLEMYANWMEAVHLGTAGDEDENSAWWSLRKKARDADGPNEHGGRAAAHAFRFLDECRRIGMGTTAILTMDAALHSLLLNSTDEHGNPHAAKAEVFTNDNFSTWKAQNKATRCTQGFEMQLLALAFEDSNSRGLVAAAAKLRDFLTDSPAYSYNLETGEKRGKAFPFFELSTHGKFTSEFGNDMDALRKLSAVRIEEGGPDAGGRVPINYLNPRRGIVS